MLEKKGFLKKFSAFALVFTLILSCMPMHSFAAGVGTVVNNVTVLIEYDDGSTKPVENAKISIKGSFLGTDFLFGEDHYSTDSNGFTSFRQTSRFTTMHFEYPDELQDRVEPKRADWNALLFSTIYYGDYSSDLSGKSFDIGMPLAFSEVNAKIYLKPKKYEVKFELNGGNGTAPATQHVEYLKNAQNPLDPERNGYKFLGWQLNGKDYDFNTPVTADITLTANWGQKEYDVTFDEQGGSDVQDLKVKHGDKIVSPVTTKAGYAFKGWFNGDNQHDFSQAVTSPLQLTAKWEAINGGGNNPQPNNDPQPNNPISRTNDDYNSYSPAEEVIKDTPVPLGKLAKGDHSAYIQGYPTGEVKGERYITREETAAIFFRLLDKNYRETIRSYENEFSDIGSEAWSNKHISTLVKGDILTGYGNGKFEPGKAITRAELATIASKFDKLETGVPHNFSDVKGHWAEKNIASAAAKGWIAGYKDGTFKPDQKITRSEFVAFINNVLGRHVRAEDILPGVKKFKDLNADEWYYTQMTIATNSYLFEEDAKDKTFQKWTEVLQTLIEM